MAGKSSCSPTPLTSLPLLTDGDGTAVYTGAPGCGYGYSYPYYGGYSYPYYDYYPYGGKGLCMSIVPVCQHHSLRRDACEHENSIPCPCQELHKLLQGRDSQGCVHLVGNLVFPPQPSPSDTGGRF